MKQGDSKHGEQVLFVYSLLNFYDVVRVTCFF